jgi:tRNA-Thr(GGU) m(6)t(6)A37 methyltransferase TsaA
MITMTPVGYVRADRATPTDDYWGATESQIVLADDYGPEALLGIEEFSHVEVLFYFDRVSPETIARGARHPRNNPKWPMVGIFAQRAKNRPNRIGSTIVRVIRREDRTLVVGELDAIDGTPVLDIKPVVKEFLPREAVRQPAWSSELMADYWRKANQVR